MHATDTRASKAGAAFDSLSRRARRRLLMRSLLRALFITTGLLVLYFVLPLESDTGVKLVINVIVAMAVVGVVSVLNIWSVVRSPYPRLRAVDAAATVVPLLVVLISATYVEIEAGSPQAFSEPLSKSDGLYFTITVLSTVGFGDITPVATPARIVTMVQMLGDLVLFGLFARFLANAMTEGLRRRAADRPADEDLATDDGG